MLRTLFFSLCFALACLPQPLRADSTVPTAAFNLNFGGNDPRVFAVATQKDGKILAAGPFQTTVGATGTHLLRLNTDGTVDADFHPTFDDGVSCIAIQPDGKILVGGAFRTVNAVSHPNLVRLELDGTVDGSLNITTDGSIYAIALQEDGKILLGGNFRSVNEVGRDRVARVDTNGKLDGFDPSATGEVFTILDQPASDTILFGGAFGYFGDEAHSRIARTHRDGSIDSSFNPSTDGVVFTLAEGHGKIYLGGSFYFVNEAQHPAVARLNSDGTLDDAYTASVLSVNLGTAVAYTMTPQADGALLIGGVFDTVSQQPRSYFARLLPGGAVDTNYLPTLDGPVIGLSLQSDGQVLLGGAFNQVNGEAHAKLARLTNDPGASTLTTNLDSIVWQRSGTVPEIGRALFERSRDGGATWEPLGPAARTQAGWEFPNAEVNGQAGMLRARGFAIGGYSAASTTLVEQTASFDTETFTAAPLLRAPLSNSANGRQITLSYRLPEDALADSVVLDITDGASVSTSLTLASTLQTRGEHTATIDALNLGASSAVAAVTGANSLPDGAYTFTLHYRDAAGHSAASAQATNVGIDATITAPTLTQPAQNALTKNPIAVDLTLPETAKSGSVLLTFQPASGNAYQYTLAATDESAGKHTFTFDPAQPTTSSDIASGSALPDGIYSVTLSYSDLAGNTAASTANANVRLDRTPPTILSDPTDFAPLTFTDSTPLPDFAAELQYLDLTTVTVTQSDAPGTLLAAGQHDILLTATDALGNVSTITVSVDVRISSPSHSVLFSSATPVPGAGDPNSPPAGASFISYGPPAIDQNGTVAFTAKYTSPAGRGSGVFTASRCVAITGAELADLPGMKITAFSDPVIDDGHVAFIATVAAGRKTAKAVVTDAFGSLNVVAVTGTPMDDGVFTSFRTISLRGGRLAILADFTVSSTPRAVSREPVKAPVKARGLWLATASAPLQLCVRTGVDLPVEISTRRLKSLVTLTGGDGSPGQGRGWLDFPFAPAVLALGVFDAQTETLFFASPTNTNPSLTASPHAQFTSFGVPAFGGSLRLLFRATLNHHGDATAADDSGIYAYNGNDAAKIVREGDPAASGETFTGFKDPVLAADDSLAFLATSRAGKARGAGPTSLWFQPKNGQLNEQTRVGADANGVDGGKFAAFQSLAIAPTRGPLFVASLAHKAHTVTPADATGLWATDFSGALRLLIRAGVTEIDGQPIKSFTALTAVPSVDGTRSFNDQGQVIWRATFKNGSQELVLTQIP